MVQSACFCVSLVDKEYGPIHLFLRVGLRVVGGQGVGSNLPACVWVMPFCGGGGRLCVGM